MLNNNDLNLDSINSRIIDGTNSEPQDLLYLVASTKNYVKNINSKTTINVNKSGNFYTNTNPINTSKYSILDGGDSSRDNSQFIAPIIGGVDPI